MSSEGLKYAKEYQDFINSLIREGKIIMNKKQSLKDEIGYIKNIIKNIKTRNKVSLVARDGSKIVGSTSIELKKFKQNHIGKLGITIRNGYRGIGLGKYIMADILKLAKKQLKPTPRIFQLGVLENNKPALALYKSMGFKIVAKLPKQIQYKGKLMAEYIMIKEAK